MLVNDAVILPDDTEEGRGTKGCLRMKAGEPLEKIKVSMKD